MRSPYLSVLEKVETTLFLLVYHVPVLSGVGLLLTVLRPFGIGDLPTVAVLPLSMLLFVGPLAELCVGLLIGRVERRSAWRLLGFLPSFALAVVITPRAYVDGMLGRPYTWVKTSRAGTTSTVRPAAVDQAGPVRPAAPTSVAAPSRPRTFAATSSRPVSER